MLARRYLRNAYVAIVQSLFDEVLINLYMFSSIMLDWVISNADSCLIIAEKFHKHLIVLVKIDNTFCSQISSHIPKHIVMYSTSTLLLTTTPYFLLLKVTRYCLIQKYNTRGKFSINNRPCPVRICICLNTPFVSFSEPQFLTRSCFSDTLGFYFTASTCSS